MASRLCRRCHIEQPIELFSRYKSRGFRLSPYCRPCRSALAYYFKRRKKYGLSADEWDAIKKKHHGRCAICKRERPLVTDHCHRTGLVRGPLCRQCNSGVGFFEDNTTLLLSAINYLNNGEELALLPVTAFGAPVKETKRGDGIFFRDGSLYIQWTAANGKRMRRRAKGDTLELARIDRAQELRKVNLQKLNLV